MPALRLKVKMETSYCEIMNKSLLYTALPGAKLVFVLGNATFSFL